MGQMRHQIWMGHVYLWPTDPWPINR